MNASTYFEIPVHDLVRAMAFYSAVFGYALEATEADGNAMAFFPYDPQCPGASGALARGESYVPGHGGVRVYLQVASIAETLARAAAAGGRTLYPETVVGSFGSVAEIEDSEGNCIGLHTPA